MANVHFVGSVALVAIILWGAAGASAWFLRDVVTGLPGATALVRARASGAFSTTHDQFWAAAPRRLGDSDGTRAMVDGFLVHRQLPAEAVIAGMRAALADVVTSSADAMAAAVTDRTRLLFICNPNNPTSVAQPARVLLSTAKVNLQLNNAHGIMVRYAGHEDYKGAATFAAAQERDGYLGTVFGRVGQPPRYSDLEWGHELYNDGHLIQAAVARGRTTGARPDQLVDVATNRQVWGETYKGKLDDIFEIQEQVARAIVDALNIQLSTREAVALADRPIRDARAYECYLRARYETWRLSSDGLARARRYIESALAIVGDNELLYSTLGHITIMHLDAGVDAGDDALDRVDELADRVFALNPDSSRGHWQKAARSPP